MRPAAASEAKPIVVLYAESGKGKTKSALMLAKGFEPDMNRVVMIETEAGRGEAYARDPEVGGYQVIPLRGEFSPKTYGQAIAAAEAAKARVCIIDSGSHEWEGVGGVLAMAAANQEANRKGPLIWQKPKIEHQREFVGRLTQTPIPLVIVTLRAKYPMFEVQPHDIARWEEAGKPGGDKARPKVGEWARSWRLEPKQADDFLYEAMVHGWIDEAHRFHVTKYTLDELRAVFLTGEQISVETGKRLALWANFEPTRQVPDSATNGAGTPPADHPGESDEAPPEVQQQTSARPRLIDVHQRFTLERYLRQANIPAAELCDAAKVKTLAEIPEANYQRAEEWIKKRATRSSPPASV